MNKITHSVDEPAPGFWRRLRLKLFGQTRAELERDWKKLYGESLEQRTKEGEAAQERIDNAQRLYRAALRSFDEHRNVSWPKPAKRIPRKQVLADFAQPLDKGLPAALHQEIDDYLQELLDPVSQPPSANMPETLRLHIAGGIEHVRLLQKHLLDLHSHGVRADAELEEGEGQ